MDSTQRLALPLLSAGQMQKELWHNEALALVDLLVGGLVEGAATASPPASPLVGSLYLVGASATGAWSGRDGQVAGWLTTGWRFVVPPEGLRLTERSTGLDWRRLGSGWSVGQMKAVQLSIGGVAVVGARGAAIASPAGGSTVDAESRTCLQSILSALRTHGLIET